jgi:hypothetical protein
MSARPPVKAGRQARSTTVKKLLGSGTIIRAEFDAIKAKALGSAAVPS